MTSRTRAGIIGTFARNLRAYRLKSALSQEALADRAKLHRTYIGSAERGERNVSIKNLERIASALDVSPADLISEIQRTKK